MSEVRLIDANALKYKNLAEVNGRLIHVLTAEEIDNVPTIIWCSETSEGLPLMDLRPRPQGEWKYICSYANTHLLRYECSKCGRTVDVYKRQELLAKYPFCHCGADMRKEDNP